MGRPKLAFGGIGGLPEFEPVEEYTKTLFMAYKQIRAVVVGRMAESSAKRAQLANRYRKAEITSAKNPTSTSPLGTLGRG